MAEYIEREKLLELIDKELSRMSENNAVERALRIFQKSVRGCPAANIVETNEKPILYECNRKKCEICSQECRYTDDIRFAQNFYGFGHSIFERTSESLKHSGDVDQILSAVAFQAGEIAKNLEKMANCVEIMNSSAKEEAEQKNLGKE